MDQSQTKKKAGIDWLLKYSHGASDWNSSAGILSPPIALFIVMLPKAHLTSHSRMSGSRWVIIPLWLSESWISFLYSSSVYSCHLFLLSSVSVGFIPFLSFIVPIFAWNVPFVSLILLKRSLVFPILLFSSISFHCSLRKAFLSLFAILWNSAFRWVYLSFSPLPFASLLFSALCKPFSDNHLAFLHFFFLEMVLITTSYTMLWTMRRSMPFHLFIFNLQLFLHWLPLTVILKPFNKLVSYHLPYFYKNELENVHLQRIASCKLKKIPTTSQIIPL